MRCFATVLAVSQIKDYWKWPNAHEPMTQGVWRNHHIQSYIYIVILCSVVSFFLHLLHRRSACLASEILGFSSLQFNFQYEPPQEKETTKQQQQSIQSSIKKLRASVSRWPNWTQTFNFAVATKTQRSERPTLAQSVSRMASARTKAERRTRTLAPRTATNLWGW